MPARPSRPTRPRATALLLAALAVVVAGLSALLVQGVAHRPGTGAGALGAPSRDAAATGSATLRRVVAALGEHRSDPASQAHASQPDGTAAAGVQLPAALLGASLVLLLAGRAVVTAGQPRRLRGGGCAVPRNRAPPAGAARLA